MRTETVLQGGWAPATVGRPDAAQRFLLLSGALSSLVYVAADVLGALRWEGYSPVSQAISELSAIDAPSRPIMLVLGLLYDALVIAFGVGMLRVAGRSRALRVAGALTVAFGVFCLTGPFTPMHRREALAAGGATLTDTLHIAATIGDMLFIFAIIGFAAAGLGRRFRLFSLAIVLTMLVFGTLTVPDAPRLQAGLSTPWLGLVERINNGAFLLWFAVLAVVLVRRNASEAPAPHGAGGER